MQNLWLVEIAVQWPFRERVSMNTDSKWISFRMITRHSDDSGKQWGIALGEKSIPLRLSFEQIPGSPPIMGMDWG